MASTWINVPFRWHGRDRNGCDCIGLIIGVLGENKIIHQDYITYINKITYGTNLSKVDKRQMEREILYFFTETGNIKSADMLLVELKNSPIHFVICERVKGIDRQQNIIHSSSEIGKVCQTNLDITFKVLQKFYLKKLN